jgi:hypothetical protein
MSYNLEIIIGLALGGTLLWWWKTTEDEKLHKQEQEHRQYIQNLALNQDFNRIRVLNIDDFTMLLGFLTPEDASRIREKKRDYEEQIKREAEERERQAAIERERLRIEENRRKQVRMMELVDSFDLNIIKSLNESDFNELVKYLEPTKIGIASSIRSTFQMEMRLKRESDALRVETEHLRLERTRIERERERERQNELIRIRTQEVAVSYALEYQKGYDKGQVDGVSGNHAANSWDWFFNSNEYKKGYEIGYNKSRQIREKEIKVVVIERPMVVEKTIQKVDDSKKEIAEIKNQLDKAVKKVEKMGGEIKEELAKVKESNDAKAKDVNYCLVESVNPYVPVDEPENENEMDSDSDSDSEESKKTQDIEKQMNILDMMMHN